MKSLLIFGMLSLAACNIVYAQDGGPKFERAAFYNTMANGDLKQIDSEIILVQQSGLSNKQGYEGALLMRKSGLLKKAKEKLRFFKEGRIKMETTLLSDSTNTEIRFLRLTIEERSPKIVKYKSDLQRDRLFVQSHFRKLSPVVQQAVKDYCKTSKILKRDDLN